jgi:PAS domain S-box-containing protein
MEEPMSVPDSGRVPRPHAAFLATHAATAGTGTTLLDELLLAVDYAPVGLCVLQHRVIRRCNRRFTEMFGYADGELTGVSIAALYPSREEFEHFGRLGQSAFLNCGSYSDDRIMRKRNDRQFWCHAVGRSLDPADPAACSVWMFEDISAQRPITADLTPREREVVRELVTGKTSKQIAKLLAISHRTVEAHRARLMRKLDAATPAEMIARLAGANG